MAEQSRYPGAYPRLVTKIISSYVSHHNLGPEQIPELINLVHRTMDNLGKPAETPAALSPAVPIRRSVQKDAVVCLDCGWRGKMLRRHLSTRHGLTADEYLRRWKLANDHPLTAPSYSEQRSVLAKELGLGRGRTAQSSGRSAAIPPPARRGRPRGRPRNADR
jgi:predicted transcriptional regulator